MDKIYKGDIAVEIRLDMQEDLTGFTNLKWYVKKPNRREVEWAATVEEDDDGVSSILKHVVLDGDLNVAGVYYIQPYGEYESWKGRGVTVKLDVFDYHQ